jgi:hypothetical protein
MSQTTTPPVRLENPETAANDALTPEQQAAVDAEHASTGWNPYDVWRTRVFVRQKSGYNGPRGKS